MSNGSRLFFEMILLAKACLNANDFKIVNPKCSSHLLGVPENVKASDFKVVKFGIVATFKVVKFRIVATCP